MSDWFQRPMLLIGVVIVAVLALARSARRRRDRAHTAAWVGRRVARLRRGASALATERGMFASLLGLALVWVGVATPTYGERARTAESAGSDLAICVDVSRSMLARDLAPDRLRRVIAEIEALLERSAGDRIALIAFAGEARRIAPLTDDPTALRELARTLSPATVSLGGTDLAAAITLGRAALATDRERARSIVLLTDGEDRNDRGRDAATAAAKEGIVVHSIGFGSAEGSKIPIEVDGIETFLRDAQGADVVTALDPASLRAIADAGGGVYVDGNARDLALVDLHARRIGPLARARAAETIGSDLIPRQRWCFVPALLLLCFALAGPRAARVRSSRADA
jgi:Ca-activated chloride channel family protein